MRRLELKNPISGVLRAKGAYHVDTQRLVRKHCEAGNAQAMIVGVADFLLLDAMARGRIPANAGIKTKDLLERTEAALFREAEAYHEAGGFLIAKGFISIQGLVAEMAKQWIQTFSAPIPENLELRGTLSDPEVQDRLTLVALKLRELLYRTGTLMGGMTDETCDLLELKTADIEGLCQRAATVLFTAFENPNATNHSLIHGESDE